MATKKVSAMTELAAGGTASDDYLVVSDISQNTDRKIALPDVWDAASSVYARTWLDDANAAAVMTTLGIDAFAQGWLADNSLADWLTTVGLDTDLATLTLPANTTITTFAKTWLARTDENDICSDWDVCKGWQYGTVQDMSGVDSVTIHDAKTDDMIRYQIIFANVTAPATWTGYLQMGYGTTDWEIAGYESTRTVLFNATSSTDVVNSTGWVTSNISAGVYEITEFYGTYYYMCVGWYTNAGTAWYRILGYHYCDATPVTMTRIRVTNETNDWTTGSVVARWRKD